MAEALTLQTFIDKLYELECKIEALRLDEKLSSIESEVNQLRRDVFELRQRVCEESIATAQYRASIKLDE